MVEPEPSRPDDRHLLRSMLRHLAIDSGVGVLFAGLVDDDSLTITELLGTSTDSLRRLWVRPGEGVGGGAMARLRPTVVADYVSSDHISHQHDAAVRQEGLRSMIAVPVMVDGSPRAVVYAATRERVSIGDVVADDLLRSTRAIASELQIRDEVDRRLSVIRGTELALPNVDRDVLSAVQTAHAELVALASSTPDPELARTILGITGRLTGGGNEFGRVEMPDLTRRESDVLAQVALGCSYAEAGRRLGLKPDTVKGYMQTVTRKLGVHSRHEAVATARRLRLLP
ncbi:helix-turn-helix transcriptional regulator [Microbacterium gorillae]|uniref:helix-turn-helix transcriptional regulator n=1 Tax=Microbacterium gorillae TaxID=1231063 RepID=UPI00058EDC70|nr:LuxR C-terminal-related transcriptional regulator [Microbacterium gorillae]